MNNKINNKKRNNKKGGAGGVAQVLECLPSKFKPQYHQKKQHQHNQI
jgi:hypothetical protein